MNTFYGKPINELTKEELILLGIDIQIMANRKFGSPASMIAEFYQLRENAVNNCRQFGGNYSMEKFMKDNNFSREGVSEDEINFVLGLRMIGNLVAEKIDEEMGMGKINKCPIENGFALN